MPRVARCRLAVAGAVIVTLVTSFATSIAGSAMARGAARTPPVRGLAWAECGKGFECSSLRVPVDYADPASARVAIAVSRHQAEDPAARVGTLVVNYGGPGDPGTESLRLAYESLPDEIRRRFDVVSFDPRGTGHSRPVECVDDATFERAWSDDPTPNGDADLPHFYDGTAFSIDLVAECVTHNGEWLAHVGTRNVARDLDRLRARLGEPTLNFLGYSYGTVIGAVYAQEFPSRVRTLVLDSAVDLSSSMAAQQRENAAGFERALDEFLADCTQRDDCPFASGGDPRRALENLRSRFESGERLRTRDGRTVGNAEFYIALLAALYAPSDWSFLAEALQEAATDDDGSGLAILNDVYAGRRDDGTYSNFQQVLGVILCDDQPEPRVSFDTFRSFYSDFASRYPFFGPILAGSPLGCDPRLPTPRVDEMVGDVRTTKAPPVLVIGTTRDPATPYGGAVDLQHRLARSRLLTVDDTRHGSYATGNPCVDATVDRYLLTRRLPDPHARCGPAEVG